MKALVLSAPGRLEMREVPAPAPGRGEVLVRTCAATICTSDIQDIRHNHFGIRLPMIMGHEGAGIVEAVGEGVDHFRRGDAVAAHPVIPCGECDACKRGYAHLCDGMSHLGIDRGGVFAEYFTLRADRLRPIPPSLSFAEASLMEPVCVCLQAIGRANIPEDGNVLVIGDGPFGILLCRLLRQTRAGRVILTGRHAFRMGFAGDAAIVVREKESADLCGDILSAAGGAGVDSAILCAGSGGAVATAIACLRARGTLSVFSAVKPDPPIDLFKVHVKELNLCGSCNDSGRMEDALARLTDKSLGLEQVITHRLPFDRWREAFRLAEFGRDEALKVTMTFEEGGA